MVSSNGRFSYPSDEFRVVDAAPSLHLTLSLTQFVSWTKVMHMFVCVWLLALVKTNYSFIELAHEDTMLQFDMDTPLRHCILTLSQPGLVLSTLNAEHQAG